MTSILAAFDLGSRGRLSSGPVASGRIGAIWRLDTEQGSWAIKQVGDDVDGEELAELLEGAAFQEAARAAGVPTRADNVRRARDGGLCVFDFDNAGLADPSQELALILVEYGTADPRRASIIRAAYAEAGGPGRVNGPEDFAMPIAQLSHIVEEGCRRWLAATTDAEREDNANWVREFLDRPLTRTVIEALLAGDPREHG